MKRKIYGPPCDCHQEPKLWHKDARKTGGGEWICAVRFVEYHRKYQRERRRRRGIPERTRTVSRAESNRRWREKHSEQWSRLNRAAVHRRRARLRGNAHEPYDLAEVFAQTDGLCAYCDDPATTIDHIIPVSKGGADAAWNVIGACVRCNTLKGTGSLPRIR